MKPFIFALLFSLLTSILVAQERVALLIGNNAYENAVPLRNPRSDATALQKTLEAAGYNVTIVLDGGTRDMTRALGRFCEAHKGAESVVFFYAGHGIEVEGENYLLPVDSSLEEKADLGLETLPLRDVMEQLAKARIGLKIIVLDCCRDNPFGSKARSWMLSRGGGGLAEVKQNAMAKGTVLVFSGEPGQTVPDGEGGNSPFTTALIEQLQIGGSVLDIFAGIAEVIVGPQKPWVRFDGSTESLLALNRYMIAAAEKTGNTSMAMVVAPSTPPVLELPSIKQDGDSRFEQLDRNFIGAISRIQEPLTTLVGQYRSRISTMSNSASDAERRFFSEELAKLRTPELVTSEDIDELPENLRLMREVFLEERAKISQALEPGLHKTLDIYREQRSALSGPAQGQEDADAALVKLLMKDSGIPLSVETWSRISENEGARGSAVTELGSGSVGDTFSVKIGAGEVISLKYIPSGNFTMGSPDGEEGRKADEDQVKVTLSNHFWMSETEVTQGQWTAVMKSNPSQNGVGMRLPAEMVSWELAQEFVSKLNEKGMLPSGWRWSLPTEAQWEYACRAGTITPFHFGNIMDGSQANCDGYSPYGTSNKGIRSRKNVAVGSYPANAWGLLDMHGNVREWCLDSYRDLLIGGRDPVVIERFGNKVYRGGKQVGSWKRLSFGKTLRSR